MVEAVTQELKSAIAAAVTKAERRTSAEIAVVIAPASDAYQAYLLMYGFALGSVLGILLWWTKALTAFPMLMLVQALAMGCFAFLPFLRRLGMALLPGRILHHHAARRAAEEFLFLSRHVPPERVLVLMYVSLAERYAHILHSRAASAKIPAAVWDDIVSTFTGGVKKPGLRPALEASIAKIADALEPHFPDRGEPNLLRDDVR